MARYNIVSRTLRVAFFINILLLGIGFICGNDVEASEGGKVNLEKVSAGKWRELEEKKIFFGHQSVGYNILDGVEMVEMETPVVKLNVVKLNSSSDLDMNGQGVLFHTEIGSNFNPVSKIDDFTRWLDNGVGTKVDIAFLKFCFVDIGTKTDLNTLFNKYKKTMAELKQKYPALTIVHFTVPLVSEREGAAKWKHNLKKIVKRILGKNEFYENVNKYYYNEMIRSEYAGKEPVFDLAAIESTFPDGRRLTFPVDGKNIENMVPSYTNDGGHLTAEGEKRVATSLLIFLANL